MNNVNSLLKAYMDCLIYILENHIDDQLSFLNERVRTIHLDWRVKLTFCFSSYFH